MARYSAPIAHAEATITTGLSTLPLDFLNAEKARIETGIEQARTITERKRLYDLLSLFEAGIRLGEHQATMRGLAESMTLNV